MLSLMLAAALSLLPIFPAFGEDRPVLTIGDVEDRSGSRMDGEDQLGLWQYLEDQLGVEIRFVYLQPEAYAAGLSSGDLPDIVATNNNLATILDNGVALNADPYLSEYAPNFLKGETRLAYDVFKQLLSEGDGFYFFPQKIGYNGVGYSNSPANRGYVVRWDYYKELGYPPINNEDDYLNVLQQMHKNHPVTEDGYPTYLFGTHNFKGYTTAFRAELSLDYWAAYKYQNNIFTNEVFDGYTDVKHSMWWASTAWLNRLYRAGKADGSFDMEILTQSEEQYRNWRDPDYARKHNCQYDYMPYWQGMLPDGKNAYNSTNQANIYYAHLPEPVQKCFKAYGVETYNQMLSDPPAENPAWYPMWSFSNSVTDETDYGKVMKQIDAAKHKYLPLLVMSEDFEKTWEEYSTEYGKIDSQLYFDELTAEVHRRVEAAAK